MMKILAIIGTPTREKGYTTKTVDALCAAVREQNPETECDYLFLGDLDLGRCQGHLTCIKQGEQACPFATEVAQIAARMDKADAVIFASPVHCFNVSTLMKNMIDLFVYQMHRPSFFGKKAVVVTSAAGAGQQGVLRYLKRTVGIWGFHVVGRLGSHAGLFEDPRYIPKLKAAAHKVAGNLSRAVERNITPQPGIADLINSASGARWSSAARKLRPTTGATGRRPAGSNRITTFPRARTPLPTGMAAMVEKLIDRTIRNAGVKPVT